MNCFPSFFKWLKSWFISNENEIDKESEMIANRVIPIILPLIRTEIKNIIDTKHPAFKTITDEIVNEVL